MKKLAIAFIWFIFLVIVFDRSQESVLFTENQIIETETVGCAGDEDIQSLMIESNLWGSGLYLQIIKPEEWLDNFIFSFIPSRVFRPPE